MMWNFGEVTARACQVHMFDWGDRRSASRHPGRWRASESSAVARGGALPALGGAASPPLHLHRRRLPSPPDDDRQSPSTALSPLPPMDAGPTPPPSL